MRSIQHVEDILELQNIFKKMATTKPIHYLNGKFLTADKAKVSIFDLGILRGYGIFDYFVTYDGQPFLLDKHINRFFNSGKIIGLTIPYTKNQIKKIILKTLLKNKNGHEKSVRIVMTGGVSVDAITPSPEPTFAVLVDDRHFIDKKIYQNGAKVITIDAFRETPQAKSINYTIAVKATLDAKNAGAIEAIYVSKSANKIYEGTTSNLFIVKKGIVSTVINETLPGITRELVFEICKINNFVLKTRDIKISELYDADEVFICASNKEVLPVVRVDHKKIGDGKPGKITKEIMRLYREYVKLKTLKKY
jgi:branched-chain amino acid aminotransferase